MVYPFTLCQYSKGQRPDGAGVHEVGFSSSHARLQEPQRAKNFGAGLPGAT